LIDCGHRGERGDLILVHSFSTKFAFQMEIFCTQKNLLGKKKTKKTQKEKKKELEKELGFLQLGLDFFFPNKQKLLLR
jgi:hypothetical protein